MRIALLAVGLAVAAGAVLLFLPERPAAGDEKRTEIVYLSVTGDGPTAKAWYRGAPPIGLLVQDALDHFSQQGFRVSSVTAAHRPTVVTNAPASVASLPEQAYLILLER